MTLFRVLVFIGMAGNAIVGAAAFFFMISGLTGTGFLTKIEEESISTTKVILSVLFLLIVTVLCVVAIIGLSKMLRRDKNGRKLFLLSNLVWILLTALLLTDYGFYQLGIFSAIYMLVIFFLSRDILVDETSEMKVD